MPAMKDAQFKLPVKKYEMKKSIKTRRQLQAGQNLFKPSIKLHSIQSLITLELPRSDC